MKKQVVLIVVTVALSLLGTEALQAGVWVGPNLVTNGNFSAGADSWTSPQGFPPSGPWNWTYPSAICEGGDDAILYQTVWNLQSGKRYRVSGQSYAYHSYDGALALQCRSNIGILGILETDWWNSSTIAGPKTTKTAEGILVSLPQYGKVDFVLTHDALWPAGSSVSYGEVKTVFDNVGLYQVVYSPTISISQKQNGVRINSNTPGGSSANISLTLNNATGYADALTSWSMNWGDGAIESNPTFNSHSHTYSITSGNSQTWTSTFSGTNQAETVFDTDTVTILRQPDIALLVNDMFVIDGQTVLIDIFDNPTLNLSLLNSEGYLEGASFQIDGKLNQTGSDLLSFLYSGNLFDESDIGLTYSLTAGVYNTGLGVNSDSLNVNLSVVPEPATLLLLGFGGMILRTRRKA